MNSRPAPRRQGSMRPLCGAAATKADIAKINHEIKALRRDVDDAKKELRRDLHEMGTRLDARIDAPGAHLKADILRWLIVTQLALAGFFFAAVKSVKRRPAGLSFSASVLWERSLVE